MARTIIVGDVHGCADELSDLLARVAPASDDRIVLVGDLVGRGPAPHRTVELARQAGALAVRGNHEDHFLRWRHRGPAPGERPTDNELRRREHAAELSDADWAYLERLPLWLELPEHDVLVVHAGLVPGVALTQQSPKVLLSIRCVTDSGEPSSRRGGRLWGERYVGPPHVLFGHNAREEPQVHRWATGLDTGCVYGGRLTALVLEAGCRVPPGERRLTALVSVPARHPYVPIQS